MALTRVVTDAEADAVASVCEEVVSLLARVNTLLEHNSDLSIDWAAAVKPDYIEEDVAGNLVDRRFTRQNVANAIGSLSQIRSLLTGAAASQGDHLGNLNLLARPLKVS